MTIYQHAAQIWSVLVWAARCRQTLTYELLGKLIGIPPFGLGRHLEPVQSYCVLNKLPPLTSLVVQNSGFPGVGFTAADAAKVPQAQAEVFDFDWLSNLKAPTPEQLQQAVMKLPSNGVHAPPDSGSEPPTPTNDTASPSIEDAFGRQLLVLGIGIPRPLGPRHGNPTVLHVRPAAF